LAEKRELLRAQPDDLALLNDTAWMLATNPNASIRNGPEAVELAQRAARLSDAREPAILGTLAAAYAEAGRFPEALQTARKAVELASEQNKPSLAKSVEAKIPLYEAQTPIRAMLQSSAAGSGPP
jgi:Flp pilus assembly protein TadD